MSDPQPRPDSSEVPSESYSRYVLGVLVVVYVLNFLDRQIITILAEDIKHDLGITDAEVGFLYGTAFAVFYAVFGIPLGRLADVWSRRTLIALGLGFWSLMTAVSGMARSFGELAAARIGVGVGEASATPAAYSMLSDSFPVNRRATVLAIYSSGIYIGSGLGQMIGGQIVDRWNAAFPAGDAPLGLVGWQAAYLAVGVPGLLIALWVATLREPPRGLIDGIETPPEPHPFREFFRELRAVLPPLTVLHLWLEAGSDRMRAIGVNLMAAATIVVGAWGLIRVTGSELQWIALGIGLYASFSWMQALRIRDAETSQMIFGSASFRWVALGFAFLAFAGYGFGGWTPIFFIREHGVSKSEVGTIVGLTSALAGLIGVTLGGYLADRFRSGNTNGRLYVGFLTAVLPLPLAIWMLTTESLTTAYIVNFPLSITMSMWIGAGASTIQDLVLPRMRAVASAFYLLVITFVGLALGPYMVGQLSDLLGSLPQAMRLVLFANGLAVLFLFLATRTLARDEAAVAAHAKRSDGA